MRALAVRPAPRHFASPPPAAIGPFALILAIGSLLAAATAVILPDTSESRWIVAFLIGCTLLVVALYDRIDGLLVTMAYLVSVGLLRRLLSMVQADPQDDPLLVVGAAMAAILVLLALWDRGWPRVSRLLLLVAAMVAVTLLSVLNVEYTPLRSNLSGLLIWAVPMAWFAVGRLLVDATAARLVLRVVAVTGTASCLAGLYQVVVDLPPWDQRWFERRGYTALGILGFETLHPWGWMSSHTEFAQLAAVVLLICGLELRQAAGRRSRLAIALSLFGLTASAAALGVSGVRAAQGLAVLAIVLVFVLSGILRPLYALALVVVGGVLFVGTVRLIDPGSWTGDGVTSLARHALVGLSNPFDDSTSTLQAHLDLTEFGLRRLDDEPLGGGTSYGTPAARTRTFGAENDIGNSALAFGFPGLALVLAIMVVALHAAWRRARQHPTVVTLAVLGILVLSFRLWWAGGHYAMAPLLWLLIGHTDRELTAARERAAP